MSLDLARTVPQLEALARRMAGDSDDRNERLQGAVDSMRESDPAEVRRVSASTQGRPYLFSGVAESLSSRHSAVALPKDFFVAASDGSHIDVDRHVPARCYLINIGGCVLTYGDRPDALLFSRPALYAGDDDLYLSSDVPGARETVAVEGPILGLKRTVDEVSGLAEAVREAPTDLPGLALVDGTLVLWGLAGRGYPGFVREQLLGRGFLPAMDRLREMGRDRPLAVASYISLPQSAEVVNTLRLCTCPVDSAECGATCGSRFASREPCARFNGLLDRHLFHRLLEPGERSGVFVSNSSISREDYGPHRVSFYYLNAGEEIARVEVPEWVAADEGLLALSHAGVLDQCGRGHGYPAALTEAHEQAVISGPDRETFRLLLDETLARERMPVFTSQKNISKRLRWL